jgi:CMP-N,N'-diacetyllegionaminic acid synthase
MKVIGMIPARLGSQRVAKKNLRLLNGKPLIAYIIEAALASRVFDEIYVNSEADIFAKIAADWGVKFYQRPAELASNATINDEFADDFVQNVAGDILVQLLPTSPLITPQEIRDFVNTMIKDKYDTLVSVENHQIACAYQGKAINFDPCEPHKSSQTMIPVQSYATVLMAWTYQSFNRHMKEFGCAYHGAKGKTGYYPLKGFSTVDIDNEEDFALAEVMLQHREMAKTSEIQYYESQDRGAVIAEVFVDEILRKDGIKESDFEHENMRVVNIKEIIRQRDNSKSWCRRIINTENNSASIISQPPGEGNRLHYHPNWNEWWYIVTGQWKWEIEGDEIIVKEGDMVFVGKNKLHRITAIGTQPAVRLAVSKDLVPHVYPQGEPHDLRPALKS